MISVPDGMDAVRSMPVRECLRQHLFLRGPVSRYVPWTLEDANLVDAVTGALAP